MMYFGAQLPPTRNNTKDDSQRALVAAFRSEVQRVALLKEYGLPEEFESAIRQDLILALFEIVRNEGAKSVQSPVPIMQSATLPPVGMIHIPEGRFRLSGSRGEGHISSPFWIDEFPVTNREYLEFLNATGFMSHAEPSLLRWLDRLRAKMELVVGSSRQPNHPVTEITWTEAVAFSAWKGKRLPTALEWERGAGGVTGRLYPWGDNFDAAKCNCLEAGIGSTSPVNAYPEGRSECGCYDMAGNVFEWTDTWGNLPRFSHAPGSEKINKGGSYNRSAQHLLNSYAESDPLDLRMADVGFRCAWDHNSSHVFRT
jgi:formylglycine-generating enzyme required for sulfatase activity